MQIKHIVLMILGYLFSCIIILINHIYKLFLFSSSHKIIAFHIHKIQNEKTLSPLVCINFFWKLKKEIFSFNLSHLVLYYPSLLFTSVLLRWQYYLYVKLYNYYAILFFHWLLSNHGLLTHSLLWTSIFVFSRISLIVNTSKLVQL